MTALPHEPHFGLVVEGRGDVGAVPVLLRAYLHAIGEFREVLGKPVACNGRDKALMAKGLEGYVATAASRPGCIAVMVVLDGEGDAVCALGPELLRRAREVSRVPVQLCLADASFEDWLFASAETLDLPGLAFTAGVSGGGAIKAALMPRKYVKPTLQPRLASRVDLSLARSRSHSLDRLLSRFDGLLVLLP